MAFFCAALARRVQVGTEVPSVLLLADVQHLLYFGHYISRFVLHFYSEGGFILRQRLQLRADVVELRVAKAKLGAHLAFAGLAEADGCRLVPDNVVTPKVV